jgi:2,3,4,5-tetrahydropyridine-2-carboxylate N-succinyltransferase
MYSFGLGLGTQDSQGNWLEVFYPSPQLDPDVELISMIRNIIAIPAGNSWVQLNDQHLHDLSEALHDKAYSAFESQLASLTACKRPVVLTVLETDAAPVSVPEVYLKLHLLSHRLVKPHGQNLEGMFSVLPNVAWTSSGPIAVADLPKAQLESRLAGQVLSVNSVDKFPKMTDYVVPAGVRIADTSRVRLGAYIGEGSTLMHEGFCNFNAGTEGPAMIEGRISAGVWVAANSDLGGGCSVLGTLSGGNKVVISIGENCLIGANAGLGIPLGNRCTIEAGLYLTAGTKVAMLDQNGKQVKTCKARDLSGASDMLFRRNSVTGQVECLTNKSEIELNSSLHLHN